MESKKPGFWKIAITCVIALSSVLYLARSGSDSEADKKPNTIILAWSDAPRTFDPRYAIDAYGQYMENLLHCSLITFNSDGQIIPDLASHWEWITDKVLKVYIKENVKFSDGSTVSSDDVRAMFEFLTKNNNEIPSPRADYFSIIEEIANEKNSVMFRLKDTDAAFVSNLSVGILPASKNKGTVLSPKDQISGCGPYQLVSSEPHSIILTANKHYSISNPPKISNIEIKITKDEATRLAKLRNGEIDIAQNNINREQAAAISEQYPDLKILKKPGMKTTYLGFNLRNKYLANKSVRKAINMAIDRKKIIRYILNDMAIEAKTMLPPNHYYYNKRLQNSNYNPELAKRILDEAGFSVASNGKRFHLSYKTTSDDARISIAKTIASDLSEIGIDVDVTPLEWGRFKEDVDNGRAELWSLIWMGFKDPDIYRHVFATESFPPNGGNRGWFSNSELDTLLKNGRKTRDPKLRKKIYDAVQQIISEENPYVFLFHEEHYAVMNKNIEGYTIFADGRYASLKETVKTN